MSELFDRVLGNPGNEKVLKFLRVEDTDNLERSFHTWKEAYSGFDEGGRTFFDKYGQYLPDGTKFVLHIHSIMINENTGEIFAFNTGRFSVFFKCNFIKANIPDTSSLRKGFTFDCITDISDLGDNWCFMDHFTNQQQQLKWAYEATKDNEQSGSSSRLT